MDLQQELLEKRKKLSDLKGNLSKANCAHKNSLTLTDRWN